MEVQEVIQGPVSCQGISRTPGCPCPLNTNFPPCTPVQKRGLPGVGVAGGGPGGRALSGAF